MLQFQEQNKMGGEKFHAPKTQLSFSVESISLTITPGEVKEGTFTIYGSANDAVTGFVTSSRLCMKVVTSRFSGAKDEISYRFDGKSFREGDAVDGYFRIISSQGEYELPFSVKVMRLSIPSSLGAVRNLYHFANLARTSWKEAVDVFYHPAFSTVFTASEKKEKALWRGLSARKGNQQNVEEFLVAIGRKSPVEFIPEKTRLQVDLPMREETLVPQTLEITRNGWGFTKLDVYTEGEFLKIAKPTLDAGDFREGSCAMAWAIDPSGLHAGLNLGRLILCGPFKEISIDIAVRYCMSTALHIIHHKEKCRIVSTMMHSYEDFRGRKISGKEFTDGIGTQIRRLSDVDRNNPYVSLYKIHYLVTAHRNEDALFELQNLNRRLSGDVEELPRFPIAQFELEDSVEYCYRMYLTILCCSGMDEDPIYVNQVTNDAIRQIEERSKMEPGNFWIAWLLLYASGELQSRPQDAWYSLEEQFSYGSRSPILYLEAYGLIQQNPAILHEFGEYEQQVLLYAAKHGVLTDAVMTQINYLAQRTRNFSGKLLRVLTAGYAEENLQAFRKETLGSICTILIRGNETDSRYFSWYQKGVEAELPITRLFDYYMMSMPEDYTGDIPKMVIMYFAYQSSLPYERNAYLYHYVLEHQEEYGDIAGRYQEQIRQFTEDALLQRKMNPDLAYLYEHYLTDDSVLTKEIANAAVPAVFTRRIVVKDPALHRVVLIYDRTKSEQYCALENGACYLPVYGDEAHLFFEDDNGDRFAAVHRDGAEDLYEETPMMDPEKLVKGLTEYETDNPGFDLYLAEQADYAAVTEKNVDHYRALADAEDLTLEERQRLQSRLLHYYRDADDDRSMDALLLSLHPTDLDTEARAEAIQFMVIRGLGEKALSWLEEYGAFGVDGSTLLRLCSRLLYDEHIADDPAFSEIVHECFRKGKYDESLLLYMEQYFDGLTSELEEIRKAAVNFGTDTWELCRRMLIQLLFSGAELKEREEVIDTYMDGGAEQELMASVLAQSSHFYFVNGAAMGEKQFDLIARYGRDGVPILDICRIAWLQQRAGRSGEISTKENEVTRLFLQDLMDENIIFPFFRQFLGIIPELQAYADETLVEYHAKEVVPGAHILYHYAMEKNGVREKYQVREMKEMYDCVYVTGFLLFFGEQMHYYITDDAAEKNVVESGTLGQDARIQDETDDRYGYINRISMLAALGRDEEALERIGSYAHRAYLVKRIFQ